MNNHNHIILFDGVCNLCNGFVQFVIKHDRKNIFKFSSLQSPFGQNFLANHKLSQKQFNSFIYIRNGEILQKSSASLFVLKDLGGLFSFLFVLIVFPKFIRDAVYRLVAKNRYKWFGKKEFCWMPTQELKDRFL